MPALNCRREKLVEFISAVLLAACLCGCNSSASRAESPIVDMAFTPASVSSNSAVSPLPNRAATSAEVKEALNRIFADDVSIAAGSENKVLEGDFNGDGSVDVAIIVRPAADKLPAINGQLANWTIQNPHRAFVPPRHKSVVTLPPHPAAEVVGKDELLLAMIHGNGPSGWRDPDARQAFLLRQAVGSSMQVGWPSPKLKHDVGAFANQTNVLTESQSGVPGALYWTGAGYAWHREL